MNLGAFYVYDNFERNWSVLNACILFVYRIVYVFVIVLKTGKFV